MAFQVNTIVHGRTIHHTVIKEGVATCLMSLSWWRSIGSLDLNQSLVTLKAFDNHGFKCYQILNSRSMELDGKTISIDVEVVDVPLDYNLFLGWSWFYAMTVVSSSVFLTLQFPHQGRIFTIDQLNYCTPYITNHGSNNVPFVDDYKLSYESVGVRLLKDSPLMGTFPLSTLNYLPKVATVHTMSTLS